MTQTKGSTQVQGGVRCYRCGELGHRSNGCLQRRTDALVNLVENDNGEGVIWEDEIQHEEDQSNDEEKEGIEGDNVGEILVIRRTMLAPPVLESDSWLHKNIFRTCCTSKGKLCNLIIDDGSSENLVSQEMVDKLNLKTSKHP